MDFHHHLKCAILDAVDEGLLERDKSSVRKIQLDWQPVIQFAGLLKGLPEDEPIFVNKGLSGNSDFSP